MNEAMTIGEVAKRSGVATSALRYYEDQGLIHSQRTDSGHRHAHARSGRPKRCVDRLKSQHCAVIRRSRALTPE